VIKKLLLGLMLFILCSVIALADIEREDRDFYTQDWGVMSIKQIEDSINEDMSNLEKDMDVRIIEKTDQFGMVFSFRWLKGKCDGDSCYLQNRMW